VTGPTHPISAFLLAFLLQLNASSPSSGGKETAPFYILLYSPGSLRQGQHLAPSSWAPLLPHGRCPAAPLWPSFLVRFQVLSLFSCPGAVLGRLEGRGSWWTQLLTQRVGSWVGRTMPLCKSGLSHAYARHREHEAELLTAENGFLKAVSSTSDTPDLTACVSCT